MATTTHIPYGSIRDAWPHGVHTGLATHTTHRKSTQAQPHTCVPPMHAHRSSTTAEASPDPLPHVPKRNHSPGVTSSERTLPSSASPLHDSLPEDSVGGSEPHSKTGRQETQVHGLALLLSDWETVVGVGVGGKSQCLWATVSSFVQWGHSKNKKE